MIPRETPVNQKTNQNSVPCKMPAPSFISRPHADKTRAQYPGATLGGQAGHYPTPAVKGMS